MSQCLPRRDSTNDELLGFLEAWDKKRSPASSPRPSSTIQPALAFHRSDLQRVAPGYSIRGAAHTPVPTAHSSPHFVVPQQPAQVHPNSPQGGHAWLQPQGHARATSMAWTLRNLHADPRHDESPIEPPHIDYSIATPPYHCGSWPHRISAKEPKSPSSVPLVFLCYTEDGHSAPQSLRILLHCILRSCGSLTVHTDLCVHPL